MLTGKHFQTQISLIMAIRVKAIELKASFNKSSVKGDSVIQAALSTTASNGSTEKG